MKWPRKKSLDKFKESIREKTQKMRSDSMRTIIKDTNKNIRGWMEYFKHSIGNIFPGLDGWVRERLRTIQRKRHKGKGRARGIDNQKWPNAYFAELGLISLTLTRKEAAKAQR